MLAFWLRCRVAPRASLRSEHCYTVRVMSLNYVISLTTALAPYSWPVTVLILAWWFRSRINQITEARFGDKIYAKFGQAPSDLKSNETLGETLTPPAPKQLGPSTVKWENVGDIFWLGADLDWTAQTTLRGAPKKSILHGLTQAYHHISELGLAESAPARQLSLLKSETESLPETTLDRTWRSAFSEKIYGVTRMVNGLLGAQQPGFRSSPQG
jgi:hypothetical protein